MIRRPPRSTPFPTRRSSDLVALHDPHALGDELGAGSADAALHARFRVECAREAPLGGGALRRSEEHTSELQSQSNLVCRLLLEKKKTINRITRASPEASVLE